MSAYLGKVQSIIDEFSELYGFGKGIIFRTIHWKKNSVGQVTSDVQSAINGQLLDEYDLLIALVGDRLGEPTARAESGTAEEIRIAIKKQDSIFSGKHVQVLFRSRLDVNINQIDVDQILKVKEFKSSIYKLALVAEFNRDEEIDGIINRFLMSACQQLEGVHDGVSTEVDFSISRDNTAEVTAERELEAEPGDSLGFYDEIEISNQAANTQAELIGSFGKILNDLSEGMDKTLKDYGDDQQKKRFDIIGNMLSDGAMRMEAIVQNMKECTNIHSASFENVLLMIEEFDVEGNKEGIEVLRNSLFDTSVSMARFLEQAIAGKEQAEKSPRATQKFNHGKRRVSNVMSEMINLVETIVNIFNEYVSYLDAFLNKYKRK
jgi:hypothetical protein